MDVLQFKNMTTPFLACGPWPVESGTVERIEISDCLADMPRGDPRSGLEDGLVAFFREAFRVLIPHGTLGIVVPPASHPLAISHPRHCRYFGKESFYPFARPARHLLEDERQWENWTWTQFGEDFGVRFELMLVHESHGSLEIELEKTE